MGLILHAELRVLDSLRTLYRSRFAATQSAGAHFRVPGRHGGRGRFSLPRGAKKGNSTMSMYSADSDFDYADRDEEPENQKDSEQVPVPDAGKPHDQSS